MKRSMTLWLSIVVQIQVSCALGKEAVMTQEQKMPTEIMQCKSVAEVTPFLSSKDEMSRKWAVIKIGHIGTEQAVSKLIFTFANEPRKSGIDASPIVREEVIRTLANIGGKRARQFLLDTVHKYVKEGPRAKQYAWEDKEYCTIITATLAGLGGWEDKEILDTFESTYLNDTLFWGIRQKAYEEYLAKQMKGEKIIGLDEKIRYLLKNVKSRGEGSSSDWVKGRSGVKTLEAIKNGAMVEMLIQYDEAALPYVDMELGALSPTKGNRRYEAIKYIRQRIEISIKRREQKEQEDKEQKQKQNTKG